MGKIFRRGIDFSGGGGSSNNPTASSVTFNNTDTGLNATNVQDAITEVTVNLNKNFEVLKKVTSPQTITLDITDYREFLMGRANDVNVLNDIITFDKGMRIAQMVITPYLTVQYQEAETLSDTCRGEGGFGSTGAK